MWESIRQGRRSNRWRCCACAFHAGYQRLQTHTMEHVIILAFVRTEQWLHERASTLLHTYSTVAVVFCIYVQCSGGRVLYVLLQVKKDAMSKLKVHRVINKQLHNKTSVLSVSITAIKMTTVVLINTTSEIYAQRNNSAALGHIIWYLENHTHAQKHTHTHTHIYTYIDIYTHIHIYTHTHTHTYIHTYIHTHTHIYTYIYMLSRTCYPCDLAISFVTKHFSLRSLRSYARSDVQNFT
jgi:hypothetical protein